MVGTFNKSNAQNNENVNENIILNESKNEIDFTSLFFPKTIAVIGASLNPVGAIKYVKAHLNTGMKIFPVNVNPSINELEGLPVFRSVKEIPDEIDLAIIGVPKQHVSSVIDDFKEKTVKFSIIFTSGFKESGNENLEKELANAIKNVKTRFIGPNCLGVYNPRGKLMFFPQMLVGDQYTGNISIISQSGGHTAKIITRLISKGVFIAKAISIGNAIDLQPYDFLPYFKKDPDTKAVGFYLESTKNGKKLLNNLKKTNPKKPVVIWKGGQGNTGYKATASHTGELAGNYDLWKAACKQSGTILAEDFDSFIDILTCFAFNMPMPKSLNVALIACGGGNAVEAADLFESMGFTIPPLKEETKKKIYKFIPDINTSLSNPVDLGEYGYIPQYFANAINIVANDTNIDSIVYIKESARFPMFSINFNMTPENYERETVKKLAKMQKKNKENRNIPLYLNDPLISETPEDFKWRISFKEKLGKVGIPVFNRIDILAKTVKKIHEYQQFLEKIQE
ncbi:MAG: CoA-binding protein [Promethearchaeota archaeon]